MGKTSRILAVAVLVVLIIIVGGRALVWWSLRDMHLETFTAAGVDSLEAQAAIVQALVGKTCFRNVDLSSIGDKRKEAEMSYVAAALDLYKTRFGTSATAISELNRLPEFEHANSLNKRLFEKDCSIYVTQNGSAVVACGSSRPSNDAVEAFTQNAESVQKFYLVDGSEILYIPAVKC